MIYILYGEDPSQIELKIQEIKQTPYDTFSSYDLSQPDDLTDFLTDLDSISIFDDTQLILARNADFLSARPAKSKTEETPAAPEEKGKGKRKKKEKSPADQLYESLSLRNNENQTVIYVVPSKSLRRNIKTKFSHAIIESMNPLSPPESAEKIRCMIHDAGLHMDHRCQEWFVQNMGTDYFRISQELKKLTLWNGPLDIETLTALCTAEFSEAIYTMTDRLFERNNIDLLRLYREFRKQGTEPLSILGLLVKQIRLIFQVRHLMNQNQSQNEIADTLKLNPKRVYFLQKKAGNFSEPELLSMLDALSNLDYSMKTGSIDKDTGFESFILSL